VRIVDRIISILVNVKDSIDYQHENHLMSDGKLESIDIVNIITELEENFEIEIGYEYITKENFESVEAILKMVEKIKNGGA